MPIIKGSATAINRPLDNQYLGIINFTIDTEFLQTHQNFIFCSQLIQNYLLEQFQQETMIGVQFTASYLLRHVDTGAKRLFTGSFFNTPNMSNVLSGDQFFPFRIATWQQYFLQYCNLERAANILNQNEINTKWVFHKLHSIIVSCQLLVPTHHPFIHENRLNQAVSQNGRRQVARKTTTFWLS